MASAGIVPSRATEPEETSLSEARFRCVQTESPRALKPVARSKQEGPRVIYITDLTQTFGVADTS